MNSAFYNEKQKEAIELMNSGNNVFITGGAGVGKSYIINEFVKLNNEKNIVRCAPTGIAALNIGGITLHRAFGAPNGLINKGDYNRKPASYIVKADIIIIDEISMCRLDLFEYVIKTILKINDNKTRQIIVVGDFYQLPPVITDDEAEAIDAVWGNDYFQAGYAFKSDYWEKAEFKSIILSEVMRQKGDDEMIDNLNLIRLGRPKATRWFNDNASAERIDGAIYLCGTNAKADEINSKRADEIVGNDTEYIANISGEVDSTDMPVPERMTLKEGIQVMTLVNNISEGYRNGSLGIIEKVLEDEVVIRLENGKRTSVKAFTWDVIGYDVTDEYVERKVIGTIKQIPLRIAYAITIHKSQGQTYDAVNLDPECFDYGQLYVALSRVKTIEKLYLEQEIERWFVKVSEDVKAFYREIEREI